jgi:acetyl esterase
MIKYEALIYPVLAFDEGAGYHWDLKEYTIDPSQKQLIMPNLSIGRRDEQGNRGYIEALYLEHADPQSDMVSPMFAKTHKGLPKTLMVGAEFDGLRLQGEYYAKKLADDGVDVRVIRYNGVCHAFLDKLGVFPQAEDLVQEIADDILSL